MEKNYVKNGNRVLHFLKKSTAQSVENGIKENEWQQSQIIF